MYHRPWIILCVILLIGGCGRKSPPVAAKNNSNFAISTGAMLEGAPPEVNGEMARMLQGRSAPELGQQLLETQNPAIRQQAALALADLGEKGYPHLEAALKSNNDGQRLAAIQVIDKPTLLAHRNDMVPLLIQMLYDREPLIRRSAAARLCWFGQDAVGSLTALTDMANNPNELPDIQEVARISIEMIRNPKAVPSRGLDKNMPPPTIPSKAKGDPSKKNPSDRQ